MRIPALDGLRAIAVLLVLMHHAFAPGADPQAVWQLGPIGVRLFFVLSGFLITGILLKARHDADAIGQPRRDVWIAFYLRRALRIFPLAYAVLALAWIAGVVAVREHPVSYALYWENWTMAREGFHLHTAHFWSLAVEEQFYLAWPLLMLWAPKRALLPVMIGCIVLAGAYRLSVGGLAAYVGTLARMDALAFGAILALTNLPASACLFGLSLIPYDPTRELGAVLLSGMAVQLARSGPQALRAVLAWRPLAYVGTISYGVYVIHPFAPMLIRQTPLWRILPESGWIHFVIVLGATVAVASLSWRFFEHPLNRLKDRVPYITRRTYRARTTAVA